MGVKPLVRLQTLHVQTKGHTIPIGNRHAHTTHTHTSLLFRSARHGRAVARRSSDRAPNQSLPACLCPARPVPASTPPHPPWPSEN